MKQVPVAKVRNRLKEVLDTLGPEGATIQRHGKPIAYVVRADQPLMSKDQAERREARLRQAEVENQRLIKHLRIGTRLLAAPPREAEAIVGRAVERVDLWEREGLCSRDYIERWRAMLARPSAELVEAMCGEADGWGAALRQNSPW